MLEKKDEEIFSKKKIRKKNSVLCLYSSSLSYIFEVYLHDANVFYVTLK